MDERILNFISYQNVFTMCTVFNNEPHCANCMYVFLPDKHLLVFSSEASTKHIASALSNSKVAGTILPAKQETGKVKGLQFTGTFMCLSNEIESEAKKNYYLKYPFALVMKGQLWVIQLDTVKMTDNSLGFGSKLKWSAN